MIANGSAGQISSSLFVLQARDQSGSCVSLELEPDVSQCSVRMTTIRKASCCRFEPCEHTRWCGISGLCV